jgi:hypothetical protein
MTTPTQPAQYGRIRASDAEREEYAQILRSAMTEGRLTMEIGEERLGQAYATTYRDELDPLIADLPRGAQFRTPEFLAEAQQRLRRHRNIVFSVAALLTGVWLLFAITVHPMFFWPLIPILIMMIGLRRHRRLYRWYSRGGAGWAPWARGWDGPTWDGPRAGRGWDRRQAWAHDPSWNRAWRQGWEQGWVPSGGTPNKPGAPSGQA